jgi:tRNA(Ile)-lysidine synthase
LDILNGLKEKYELELHLAHVNYSLRGKDSDKDEDFVKELAQKYQLGLSVLVLEKLKKNEISEENLRNIRYDFFEKIRKEWGYDFIAVAHNRDDQVETFLMHLLRGAGLQGLSGMKYKNDKIIRPLLGVSREEILEYLKKRKLKYRIDKTNKTNKFFRNKIRNKLVPYLENNFNPSIKETIFNSASSISEDLSLISDLSKKYSRGFRNLKASQIIKIHPSLQKRIILREIKNKKGDLKNIKAAHVEEILKIIKSVKSKNQVFLFQGLKLMRKGDKLDLLKIINKQ